MAAAEFAGRVREGSRPPRGRRASWGFGLVAAASLLAFACLARAQPDDLARPDELAVPAAIAWQRLALNALLVPLLEPEGELAWAQPNEMLPCRDSAEVSVDGRPIAHGKRLPPGRPIVVRFRLNDCWPLGTAWLGLWGTLEMAVVHEGSRLRVAVRPGDLSAASNGARVPLRAEFVGVVSLAQAAVRP